MRRPSTDHCTVVVAPVQSSSVEKSSLGESAREGGMTAVVAAVEAGVVAVASGRGCSRRLVRGLYWRLRAVLRRLRSEQARRGRRFNFHYDALSYALNFDDGRAVPADLVLAVPSDALR